MTSRVVQAAVEVAEDPERADLVILLRLLKEAPEGDAVKALRYLVGDVEPLHGYCLLSPDDGDRYLDNFSPDERDVWDEYYAHVGGPAEEEQGGPSPYWEVVSRALKMGYTVVPVRAVLSRVPKE